MQLRASRVWRSGLGRSHYAREAFASRDPLFTLLARRWPGYAQLRTDDRSVEIVAALNPPNWR
jgi:hypothetical protein